MCFEVSCEKEEVGIVAWKYENITNLLSYSNSLLFGLLDLWRADTLNIVERRNEEESRLEESPSDHIVEPNEKGLMFRTRCSISYSPSQRNSESEREQAMEVHGRRTRRKK